MENALPTSARILHTWKIDEARSTVDFSVAQSIGQMNCRFGIDAGCLKMSSPDFRDASMAFWVSTHSLDSGSRQRNAYLVSEQFLDAEQYPYMEFRNLSFRRAGALDYALEGLLTIRNLTRNVHFKIEQGWFSNAGERERRAGFKAVGRINRYLYGSRPDPWIDIGGVIVDKWATIFLHLEFTRQDG